MSAPTFTTFERNGATTGTLTNSVPQIAYAAIDAASTGALSAANAIPQNTNSAEKYNGLQVVTPATNTISSLSAYFSATAPTDSGAVALPVFYGATATYTQPVVATSTVATLATTSNTAAPGVTMTPPANTAASNSSYIVTQTRVGAAAAGGTAVFPSPFLTLQFQWSALAIAFIGVHAALASVLGS